MSGGGNDRLKHRNGNSDWCTNWSGKDSTGALWDKPSWYSTHNWTYEFNHNTGEIPGLEYPAAAYNTMDFHCERGLSSW